MSARRSGEYEPLIDVGRAYGQPMFYLDAPVIAQDGHGIGGQSHRPAGAARLRLPERPSIPSQTADAAADVQGAPV